MSTPKIKSIVEEMIQPFLDEHAFELVDVEYVKEGSNYFLRIFVDKEGGIDIDDCGLVSEYMSEKLDGNDPVPDAYFLEVSSPGAERPLKKNTDVLKAVGKDVFVTVYEALGGLKEFEGRLLSFEDDVLLIEVAKKQKKTQYSVPYEKVASARLAIIF
ncbi:ribosome maturation factor RimP [Paenibacillus sp. IHBB 10380]|uniref:ribosome maturation factor RimP n=1 Tax=Paenibacillus sp. IHBB 10380 TaxID=1566358 RepID=UPI0005CFA0F2|nr:ribosome maturation factor RimP [Paenibacillus sp. IHBB 10380]AJS59129.1 ribosome maturation factor RimP [Paenibacillus sp. IHBB 10380]